MFDFLAPDALAPPPRPCREKAHGQSGGLHKGEDEIPPDKGDAFPRE